MKVCCKCKQEKTLREFHKASHTPDGHVYKCKECCRQYQRDNKEATYLRVQKWNAANPDKIAAYREKHKSSPEYQAAYYQNVQKAKRTAEYRAWVLMRSRCNNPNNPCYSYYGGRSISVCPEWDSYDVFLQDMGKRPDGYTLDRIDSDGNYEPTNCRWATRTTQARNRRITCLLAYKGQTKPRAEWAEEYGLTYNQLNKRLWRGWEVDRALNEPIARR